MIKAKPVHANNDRAILWSGNVTFPVRGRRADRFFLHDGAIWFENAGRCSLVVDLEIMMECYAEEWAAFVERQSLA